MGNLVTRNDGALMPRNQSTALDCIASLSAAVVFSFFAIEALANAAIDQLPADENDRSPFAKLLLGGGDNCVADAVAVADAAWPGYVNERVRAKLPRS